MNGQIREVARKLTHSARLKKILVVLLSIIILLGLLIPMVERSAGNSKIVSEADGIYFAVTTVTGVGYGDLVPLTQMGRIVAMILQTVGVVLFGSIMAFVSVELLRYQEDFYARRYMDRIDTLEIKIEELRKKLDFLVKK